VVKKRHSDRPRAKRQKPQRCGGAPGGRQELRERQAVDHGLKVDVGEVEHGEHSVCPRGTGIDAANSIGGEGFPVAGHNGVLDIEGGVEGPDGAVLQGARQWVEGRDPAAPEKGTHGRRKASLPCA
jgi:hypothetical protein